MKCQKRLFHSFLFGLQMKNCASYWTIIQRVQLRTILHDNASVGVTTMISEYKCSEGKCSAHTSKLRPSEVINRTNHRNYRQKRTFWILSGEFPLKPSSVLFYFFFVILYRPNTFWICLDISVTSVS